LKKLVLLIVGIVFLSSCATTLKEFSVDDVVSTDEGYIAGTFWDSSVYFMGFLFKNSPYSIIIENSETGKKYVFNFKKKDLVSVYPIPVGSYHMISISKTTTEIDNNNNSTTRTVNLSVPEELLFDFEVKPAMTTYIGFNKITRPWFSYIIPFGSLYIDVEFNYDVEVGKSRIEKEFPNILTKDIISY